MNNPNSFDMLGFAIVLARYKKLIIGSSLLVALAATIVAFLLPNSYTGTARILPPQQNQSNAVAILGQLGVLAGAGGVGGALGIKNPNDTFVAMLKSRTVADNIIEQFKLRSVYSEELLSDARKELRRNTDISAGKDGVILIEIDDRDPQRAADLANAYISELEKLTLNLAVSEAGQRRLFFERQLRSAKDDLARAEGELEAFQRQKGLLNPQGQMGLTIMAAANLRAQITAKEVQIGSLGAFATNDNPDLLRAREELAELRSQLAKMQGNKKSDVGDVLVTMGKAPEAGAEFIRKYRDVKYYEVLFELLAKQYELARIDEAKNATLIQVLDKAIVPDKKSWPPRAIIIVLCTLVSLLISVAIAISSEAARRSDDGEVQSRKLSELRSLLR